MTDEDVRNQIISSLETSLPSEWSHLVDKVRLPSEWSIEAAQATVRWAQLIGLVATEVGSDAQGGTYVMLEGNDCETLWVGHMHSGLTTMISELGDILLKSRSLPLPTGDPP